MPIIIRREPSPHDINISELYSRIKKCYSEINYEYSKLKLFQFTDEVKGYCWSFGKNFKLFERKQALIVNSWEAHFTTFFALSLAFYDVNGITKYLDHHKIYFMGNVDAPKKKDFVMLVGNTIFEIVKRESVDNTIKRLELITKWIETNKISMTNENDTQKLENEGTQDKVSNFNSERNKNEEIEYGINKGDKIEFDVNFWNKECFELFIYLANEYNINAQKQKYINIWFYLAYLDSPPYFFSYKKEKYKLFILKYFNVKIKKINEPTNYSKQKIILKSHFTKFSNKLKAQKG